MAAMAVNPRSQASTATGQCLQRYLAATMIYSYGGHLGHVTLTIYINFLSPFPRMLHMKFGFDWPSGFRGEDVSLLWKYTCILPRGRGRQPPRGLIFFININLLSISESESAKYSKHLINRVLHGAPIIEVIFFFERREASACLINAERQAR